MKKSRMKSLDIVRGWCMIAILFFHTQMYYFGGDVVPYTLYVPNALALFYFIAGFFAMREPLPIGTALTRVALRLVMPYFIFTILLGITKQLVFTNTIDVKVLASAILSGRASWFVAALIIIEVLFIFLRKVGKDNSWVILGVGIVAVVVSYFLQRSPFETANFAGGIPFAVPPALLGMLFYCLGFLYHRHVLPTIPQPTAVGYLLRNGDENRIHARKALTITYCWLIPTLFAFAAVKIIENQMEVGFLFASLYADPFWLFVVDLLLGTIGISSLLILLWPDTRRRAKHRSFKSKRVRMYLFMSPAWIGQHCMVYYFFAGAVPLVAAFLLKKYFFTSDPNSTWYADLGFWLTLIAVVAVTSGIAWFIYRFMPFLLGRKVSDDDR